MLQLFNQLTRQKEPFKPLEPGKAKLYVCGMTVYDFCHVGHARVLITFDVITRYLHSQGLSVTYVRNITDIDDKIIERAKENHEPMEALTERFITAMHEDEAALGILSPTFEPRATQFIPHMIQMIEILVDKKFAYVAPNNDVYYDVHQFKPYGKLSRKNLEELQAGARVEIEENKRSPFDFALWKAAKPGEPFWDSPWGPGRPGWHIECSAMSVSCLGPTFDLHGGGMDLQFPHHENEIMQSEGATGQEFVKTWLHVGFVQVNQEKMSKSLGNFFTIRDVLKEFSGETIRYFILSSHYRSPLNYTEENLEKAAANIETFYLALRDLPITSNTPEAKSPLKEAFYHAMDDDFNTPEALSVLHQLAHEINKVKHNKTVAMPLAALLKSLGDLLGILQQTPEAFFQPSTLDTKNIETFVAQRNKARKNKDWQKADEIRKQLAEQGIILEDKGEDTLWRRTN